MKCLDDCHMYELSNYNDPNIVQRLHFVKMEPVEGDPVKLALVMNGTTNEEVLEMLLHRLQALYDKLPSKETAEALHHLALALGWLQHRTHDRNNRGVEGTRQP